MVTGRRPAREPQGFGGLEPGAPLRLPKETALPDFCICRRDNPHFRLAADGRDFSTSAAPMTFASHDEAFDYTVRENTNPPLAGMSVEIVALEP